MKKRFVKNSLVILASMFAFSCTAQSITNNQVPLKSKSMKILYSFPFFNENNFENTKTFIYEDNSIKIFKQTSGSVRESRHMWSFDGSKIIAYRADEKFYYDSIANYGTALSMVIYDTAGNETDIIGEPHHDDNIDFYDKSGNVIVPKPGEKPVKTNPQNDFALFHNSNNILYGVNNPVANNPYLELSANIYDPLAKTSKKIIGSESFKSSRYWPELSLDDNLVFITDNNKVNDSSEPRDLIYTLNIISGEKKLISDFDGPSYRIKWHKLDKTKFAVLIGDGDIYLIDINTNIKTLINSKEKRKAYEIEFSPDSNEILINLTDGKIILNLDTKEETKLPGNYTWACDSNTFLVNEKDGIYKTDRKMSKKELIIRSESEFPISISDINCSGNK